MYMPGLLGLYSNPACLSSAGNAGQGAYVAMSMSEGKRACTECRPYLMRIGCPLLHAIQERGPEL